MGNVDVNYKVIGLNVSTYRCAQKLTQEQLAEKAGISKQFVCNIECGRAVPSLVTLLSLCHALNVTANDLLRCSSAYNPQAPCTLREEQNVFTDTLSDHLFAQNNEEVYIRQEDLPAFDIVLPDPDEEDLP